MLWNDKIYSQPFIAVRSIVSLVFYFGIIKALKVWLEQLKPQFLVIWNVIELLQFLLRAEMRFYELVLYISVPFKLRMESKKSDLHCHALPLNIVWLTLIDNSYRDWKLFALIREILLEVVCD